MRVMAFSYSFLGEGKGENETRAEWERGTTCFGLWGNVEGQKTTPNEISDWATRTQREVRLGSAHCVKSIPNRS